MKKIKLFLVDDDKVFLKALEIEFLQHADFDIETFATGEKCLENISNNPDIIVLDYHLDGNVVDAMNGLEVLAKIKNYNTDIAVIMLSSQDKIEVAVNCMQHKAYDYIVKSETAFIRIKRGVKEILNLKKIENQLSWYMDRM